MKVDVIANFKAKKVNYVLGQVLEGEALAPLLPSLESLQAMGLIVVKKEFKEEIKEEKKEEKKDKKTKESKAK